MTVNATSLLFLGEIFMLKIVRFIWGGLDVHKNVIVATIGTTNRHNNITTYIQESFSTLNSDLYRLRD